MSIAKKYSLNENLHYVSIGFSEWNRSVHIFFSCDIVTFVHLDVSVLRRMFLNVLFAHIHNNIHMFMYIIRWFESNFMYMIADGKICICIILIFVWHRLRAYISWSYEALNSFKFNEEQVDINIFLEISTGQKNRNIFPFFIQVSNVECPWAFSSLSSSTLYRNSTRKIWCMPLLLSLILSLITGYLKPWFNFINALMILSIQSLKLPSTLV